MLKWRALPNFYKYIYIYIYIWSILIDCVYITRFIFIKTKSLQEYNPYLNKNIHNLLLKFFQAAGLLCAFRMIQLVVLLFFFYSFGDFLFTKQNYTCFSSQHDSNNFYHRKFKQKSKISGYSKQCPKHTGEIKFTASYVLSKVDPFCPFTHHNIIRKRVGKKT